MARRDDRSTGHRPALESLRFAYGATELVSPLFVSRKLLGHEPEAKVRNVIRILGARHVAQALLVAGRTPRWHHLSGMVDLVHAATAVAFAARDPRLRLPASVSAAVALAFAVAELSRTT